MFPWGLADYPTRIIAEPSPELPVQTLLSKSLFVIAILMKYKDGLTPLVRAVEC